MTINIESSILNNNKNENEKDLDIKISKPFPNLQLEHLTMQE